MFNSYVRFQVEYGETLPTVAVVRCENCWSPRDRENPELFTDKSTQRNLRYCHKPENQTSGLLFLNDSRQFHRPPELPPRLAT